MIPKDPKPLRLDRKPGVHFSKDGIDIGDLPSSCCLCVNIQSGITAIGVFLILESLTQFFWASHYLFDPDFSTLKYYPTWSCILSLPGLLGALLYGIYFSDVINSRTSQFKSVNKTPVACLLQIVSLVFMNIFELVFGI